MTISGHVYVIDSVEQSRVCLASLGNPNSRRTALVRRSREYDIVSHLVISDIARYLKSRQIIQTLHDIVCHYESTKYCNTW
jgi:hypothetical protein